MWAILLALFALGFSTTEAFGQAQAQPIAPYTLDDCQAQDAGPAQRRPGNPFTELANRRTQVDCLAYNPLISVSCTLTPPPQAETRFTAVCRQTSDFYGGIEYICRSEWPEDGVSQWVCGTVRGSRGPTWTWQQPVSP